MILYYIGYEGDLDDPNLSSNPTNSTVKNNACYLTVPNYWEDSEYMHIRLEEKFAEYGEVSANYYFYNDLGDFPQWHNGDFTMKDDAEILNLVDEFIPIPFNQIGRID